MLEQMASYSATQGQTGGCGKLQTSSLESLESTLMQHTTSLQYVAERMELLESTQYALDGTIESVSEIKKSALRGSRKKVRVRRQRRPLDDSNHEGRRQATSV